jgi:hypothetical protein
MSTAIDTLAVWHELVRRRDLGLLDTLLADEVVFHSPVVFTPQRGRPLVTLYLAAAMEVLGNPSFTYLREIVGARDAALEFSCEQDGVHVNGVDLIRWNEAGQIVDFKVMVRPHKDMQALQPHMAARLEQRSK